MKKSDDLQRWASMAWAFVVVFAIALAGGILIGRATGGDDSGGVSTAIVEVPEETEPATEKAESGPEKAEPGSQESESAKSGGGEEPSAKEGAQANAGAGGGKAEAKLAFEADPTGQLAYTTNEATTEAGEVEVDFANESSVPHNVAIESSGGEVIGETEVIAEGSDSTVVKLEPGTYTFFCVVPGHREAGMEGKLTVK